ncbi:AAA family ATPase [Trichothermofontia sp.]
MVLRSIEIQNFRCFDSLKASGFERLNLISGKNNIGKTALLEAIFLNSAPRPDTIFLLRQVRREPEVLKVRLSDGKKGQNAVFCPLTNKK